MTDIRSQILESCDRRYQMVGIVLFLFVLPMLPACDGDGPTGPEPEPAYNFYFNDASFPNRYYRYNTATETVDTIAIPYASYDGFVISGDGQRLYLSDNDTTAIVNTATFEVDTLLTSLGGAVVDISPGGRHLVVAGDDLRVIDVPSFSVVHHDTDRVSRATLSRDGQRLYAAAGWVKGAQLAPYLYHVDFSQAPPAVTRKTFAGGGVWSIVPTPDDTKWLLFLKFQTFDFLFQVYDNKPDSIVFSKYLTPGHGDMEPSLDGKLLFFTNPGTLLAGPPPSVSVTVFDIQNNRIGDSIPTPSPAHGNMIPSALAISPDGAVLVAASARGQGSFSVIETQSMKVVKHFYLGNQVDVLNVICQRLP